MTQLALYCLIGGILLCGCMTTPPRHLSKTEVIALAQQVGAEHGQELRVYGIPYAFYVAERGMCYVSFAAKKEYFDDYRWHGGFSVDIEDATRATTYHEDIWK